METTDSDIIFYQTKDGKTRIEVKMIRDTVWLSQKQMSEVFGCTIDNIGLHLKNIFYSGELEEKTVTEDFSITASDGKKYKVQHYNLDAIISVGYRVNSLRGTQFRVWATKRLREYLIKGFSLDDERLKQNSPQGRYFEELLQRVRDIRVSERNFYQKVTDIYATSLDYHKSDTLTKTFFATVQNKMHFAIHGHTAVELIAKRVDAKKNLMGLSNFKGNMITLADTHIAKNYLTEFELKQLNLIVSLYLDFAELQAISGHTMTMKQWTKKLDDFLRLSEKEVLHHAGTMSSVAAEKKANHEYEIFRADQEKKYMSDFDRLTKRLSQRSKKK